MKKKEKKKERNKTKVSVRAPMERKFPGKSFFLAKTIASPKTSGTKNALKFGNTS